MAAFAPGSFMQVNYDMMDAALAAIQSFVPHGSRVCLQRPLTALLNMCTSSCLAHKLQRRIQAPDLRCAVPQVLDLHAGVGVIGEQQPAIMNKWPPK